MKRHLLIAILTICTLSVSCQSKQERQRAVILKFIGALRMDGLENESIITQYFAFNESVTPKQIKEVVFPLLLPQLTQLQDQLLHSCNRLTIEPYQANNKKMKEFGLVHPNYENVFFINCEGGILLPVLLEGDSIKSISIQEKKEGRMRTFVIF